ncbi:unnamed protein product [Urochloa humidicola]
MGVMLWTPALLPRGCFLSREDGHDVARCRVPRRSLTCSSAGTCRPPWCSWSCSTFGCAASTRRSRSTCRWSRGMAMETLAVMAMMMKKTWRRRKGGSGVVHGESRPMEISRP